jgi:hypothetical protein
MQWRVFNRHTWVGVWSLALLAAGTFTGRETMRLCQLLAVCASVPLFAPQQRQRHTYSYARILITSAAGLLARARVALSKAERDASPLNQQRLDRSRRFILAHPLIIIVVVVRLAAADSAERRSHAHL